MENIKLGIVREGKKPIDKRVPLTPEHCRNLEKKYPHLQILIQPSEIRSYPDKEYLEAGLTLKEDLSSCDILMGVKEVPAEDLILGKKYFFFSHTIKKQPHNKKLLQTVLEKKIQLIDYECLTHTNGLRIIGFGRYAGIVGTYNALIGYGIKNNLYKLKPANQCRDLVELENQLGRIHLPDIKIVLTGEGRVAGGAKEILNVLGVEQVNPHEFLEKQHNHAIFCQLGVNDYNKRKDGRLKSEKDFFENPEAYITAFVPFTKVSDIFLSCHFWDPRAPRLFLPEHIDPFFKMEVIADISCDIGGSVPTTSHASTIEDPFYGYNVSTGQKANPFEKGVITVMAVDNLPCALPRDSSKGFGDDLIKNVLPCLLGNDPDEVIKRASITKDGQLMPSYRYLSDYAA